MSYYSLQQIKSIAKFPNVRQKNLERSLLTGKTTVFLSHSHEDADIVDSAISFLLTIGVLVYVDWLDPTMPRITSGETATTIKNRIVQCQKFVVLLSESSKNSKWVPWELGFADGKKNNSDIAILPIKRNSYTKDSEFAGLEYMELYQQIQIGSLNGANIPAIFPGFSTKGGMVVENWLI